MFYICFQGIAVDATFNVVIDQIRESRAFECKYDRALTVHFASWEAKPESSKGLVESFNHGNPYNVDPVRILYFLKQKNTAVDFFAQLDFDGSSSISREELRKGISVSYENSHLSFTHCLFLCVILFRWFIVT